MPHGLAEISQLTQKQGQQVRALSFSDFGGIVTGLVTAVLASEKISSTNYR